MVGNAIVSAKIVKTPAILANALPTAAAAGAGSRAFVTDANSSTFANVLVGGSGNSVPVYSDGTNWRIG